MTKYIYIALGAVVVVLFGALRYQSGVIDELEITTKQQEKLSSNKNMLTNH